MKTENRVAWTEGMFLRVQHFQQADRWADRLVRDKTEPLSPYPWGLIEISVDRAALGIGRFALTSIRGILRDGTPFSAPDQCDLPAPVALAKGASDMLVHLTLPMRRPGAPEFSPDGAATAARMIRNDFDSDDANADTDFSATIDVGRLALGLKLETDERAGFETLPIARITEVRADLTVVLDPLMIPPALSMVASPRLQGFLTELLGLVRHRAEAIARRAGDPSLRGSAEIGDYLMLQTLNRAEPALAHLNGQAAQIHPESVYRVFVTLAGELATFTTESRLPTRFPAYDHLDPAATFEPVMDDLRRSLSAVLDQSAVLIPLQQRRHGVRVGMLADAGLKADSGLVLTARADMPQENLRRMLPNQIKIGPVERISELVNVALTGVRIRPMPVAPRQLAFRAGTVYFELETEGDIWQAVLSSGTIAIHLAAEFPGLELELWGIRA
ncbi:MAG: type VI secretion system baseplate subunit TssK [Pikeienuella sp.]